MKQFALIGALSLAGCATSNEQMKMAIEAQQNVKPTIEMTCPQGGCKLVYTDPRDRQMVKLPTNGWDFANKVTDTVGSVVATAVVPAAFAITAAKGFDALKGSGAVTTTTTTSTSSNTSNLSNATTTTTLSGTGVLGSGTHTNTQTTTSTVDSHDATAVPTVVTQPAPVIVGP
jgi:hypothetical protein